MKSKLLLWNIGLLFLIFSMTGFSHENFGLHYDDFKCIFNGYGDEAFRELSQKISTGIDHNLPERFRQQVGRIPGNHRILGHGWTLNDAIPKETLAILTKEHLGHEKAIINVWQQFSKDIINDSILITGLPKNQANAFASMLYDIHLLGDLEPNNTLIKMVLDPDKIVRNIEKNASVLFKNKPKYSDLIRRHLRSTLRQTRGKNPQFVSQAVMDELYKLRFGDMLNDTWGKTLETKYSIDRVVAANEKIVKRSLRKVPGMDYQKAKVKQPPLKKSDFNRNTKKVLRAGLLTQDGRLLVAMKEGTKIGLMVFAIEGGIATYKYFNGDILRPEFEEKVVDAAIKGTTVGTATAVAVLLGATPSGWVVFAVGTGAYVIADYTITLWRERHAKQFLTIVDLKPYGIELDSILELPKDSIYSLDVDSTLYLKTDSILDLQTDSLLAL